MLEERLKITGKLPRSRIVIASGCHVTALETAVLYARQIPEIGIFTTKSIGPRPNVGTTVLRSAPNFGNPAPIYCADPANGPRARRNAVGLANPGYERFGKELKRMREESPTLDGALLLGSAYGSSIGDFIAVCRHISPYVDAIELNFSCPHAKGFGIDAGRDADAMAGIVKKIIEVTGKDVFAKLSPNLGDSELVEIALACRDAGARGFTLINTVAPEAVCFEGTDIPILYNRKGGASGPHIKARGIDCVSRVRDAVGPDPLIIGTGGIFSGVDAQDYLESGADFVAVGSVLEGMCLRQLKKYFMRLKLDTEDDCADNSKTVLGDPLDLSYSRMRISKIDSCSGTLKVLSLEGRLSSGPGQYVFLAVPGDANHPTMEGPFSVPVSYPLTLAVRLHPRNDRTHHFTSRVFGLKEGDDVYVRGPYGVPLSLPTHSERLWLVGGGTGVAALASIAYHYPNHSAFIGAKTASELLFHDAFREGKVIAATEDGSGKYRKGMVTDIIANGAFRSTSPQGYLITCGPNAMMEQVVKIAMREGFKPDRILAVLEPYMKCGVGICGCCALGDGHIACTDGHIVTADRFMRFVKDRKLKRDASGAWE
jgi:dihydroorotate dehydrogenase (NAD+) catalytic subunit